VNVQELGNDVKQTSDEEDWRGLGPEERLEYALVRVCICLTSGMYMY